MYLATISDVLKVIRFSEDIAEFQDSVASGLEAATADLSNYLRTSFDLKTQTDKFFIEQSNTYGNVDQELFLTSNGFIQEAEPFTIIKANAYTDLGITPVDVLANCNIDYDKGTIIYTGESLISTWVSVTYTSGFGPDETDDFVYDQSKVPNWLKQAAILKAILHIDAVSPTMRHESAENLDNKALEMKYNNLVTGKIRYYPAHTKPVA